MVKEENLENATNILKQLKEKYGIHPELVVSDFSPNLLGAIKEIFGGEVIQIDGFHVMRELNNGIKRDLHDFRERHFQAEIRELLSLRNWISLLQEKLKAEGEFSSSLKKAEMPPKIPPKHTSSWTCEQFTLDLFEILKIDQPNTFFKKISELIDSTEPYSEDNRAQFFRNLLKVLPKKRYTKKGMERTKNFILQKLKTYYLGFRSHLEEKSKQFFKDHWVVFFQPENLTSKRREKLTSFLNSYPELQTYRNMTLMVGEIYRLPVDKIDGHQIDDLKESPSFSNKLNTAIRTFKKHKSSILRFINVFKKYPELPKACRSNMEYFNSRFKEPFKKGNNLLKKERLLSRLEIQLRGKIEWLLEDDLII